MPIKKQPNYRLSGINPLAYMGVEPYTPPDLTIQSFNPTVNDNRFNIGTLWTTRNPAPLTVWMLVDLNQGSATWVELYPGSGAGASEFPCNIGVANEAGGILNVLGSNIVQTAGSGNTITISLSNGAAGQVPIAGPDGPEWADLTAGDGITIVNGPDNSITISATGGEGANSFIENVGSAAPVDGVINVYGINVVHTSGSGNTINVGLSNALNGQIPIASTGNPTAYANITSNDGTVTVTNGPNSIDLSASAEVNPAKNCNFLYYQQGNSSTLAGTSPAYPCLGQYKSMTKKYDVGNNCTTGNGLGDSGTAATFTAPATGKYMLGVQYTMGTSTSFFPGFGNIAINFVNSSPPSGILYQLEFQAPPAGTTGYTTGNSNGSILVDLTIGDMVTFPVLQVFGLGGWYFSSANTPPGVTTTNYFWGYQLV